MKELDEFDDELERELCRQLRPRKAPPGFSGRVMERVLRPQRLFIVQRRSWNFLSWAAAAVLLVTVAIGGYLQYQRQQRIAGERARQQVLLALHITNATLQSVRNKIIEDRPAKEVEP